MKVLAIATRRGELAVAQMQVVVAALKAKHPEVGIRVREVTTAGDEDRRTALWDLKDTGFFTSRLEDALLAGEADVAVHSFKDLPTRERDGLVIAAICDRRWPEDCLLAGRPIASIEELPRAARVGTSSLRRGAQLRHLRPDIEPVPLRGNVQTRIRKLRAGDCDAVILARAGLERLGLAAQISMVFDPRQFIPAPGQGALAVQTRSGDEGTMRLVQSIDDPVSRALASAERQVLATMRCGCHAPVGAYTECAGGVVKVYAIVADRQGRRVVKTQARGSVPQALQVGEKAALDLLDAGGREILKAIDDL